jgi:vancomycin permeability regulator SanA
VSSIISALGAAELWIPIALLAAAGAVGAGAIFTWHRIDRAGRLRALETADVIVVLGAALNPDGTPCPELIRRLSEAATLFRAGQAERILCCGGHSPHGRSEAAAMRSTLLGWGVPIEALLVDDDGTCTRRGVAAARRHASGGWRVLFVSSDYHIYRILGEARRQSLPAEGHACTPSPDPSRRSTTSWHGMSMHALLQTLREVAAVWWYALSSPVSRLRP